VLINDERPQTRPESVDAEAGVSGSEAVSQSIRPLTTSAKMPSVTMSGKVRIFATGL
jgi:hypothetical protein